ncbi:MAG: hypothetical protein RMJ87_13650 [Cytophagales bacterium]|nr:hypothetical protein [Bernardetiaceae bacterium]MDW8206067.1 hypothetical protein [Cytophagales bacterium]
MSAPVNHPPVADPAFTSYPDPLKQAIEDAMLILSYTAERGISVPPEITQQLVQAKFQVHSDAWTPETEANFWTSYNTISQIIRPVTTDSLRAATDTLQPTHFLFRFLGIKTYRSASAAQNAVRRYTWMGLFWVVLMLTIQIYSLIGNTLMNNIASINQKITALEDEVAKLNLLSGENVILQITQNTTQIDELSSDLQSSVELLANWLAPINAIILRDKYYKKDLLKEDKIKTLSEQERISLMKKVQQVAQYPLLIANLYILPLLYGLLGAFAFVLRKLTEDTRQMVYTKESDLKYILRIHLGALAGLAVGLFFVPEDTSITLPISLSPLAVAFLTGYSVEFFFSALDRLINMVSKSSETRLQEEVNSAKP